MTQLGIVPKRNAIRIRRFGEMGLECKFGGPESPNPRLRYLLSAAIPQAGSDAVDGEVNCALHFFIVVTAPVPLQQRDLQVVKRVDIRRPR